MTATNIPAKVMIASGMIKIAPHISNGETNGRIFIFLLLSWEDVASQKFFSTGICFKEELSHIS